VAEQFKVTDNLVTLLDGVMLRACIVPVKGQKASTASPLAGNDIRLSPGSHPAGWCHCHLLCMGL
jgi:hypothetical protein